jgi:5-methyltetrahydropteroyltriglutamate--homocysteine methyltransferase
VTVVARVEHVGSLLRPGFLRDARAAYARGELAPAGLKAAEDRAVREVVAMQEEIGLPVVGDGEMRRESFQSELTAACDGFTGVDVNAWLWGAWHSAEAGDVTIARPAGLAVIAPLRKRRNLAAEEFNVPARLHQPAGQGHVAEPVAVRQPLVAAGLRRGLPDVGCVPGRRRAGAV